MKRTPIVPLLMALVLASACVPPAVAADQVSPAEQHVFVDNHLGNLPASAVLNYAYRKSEAGNAVADDEVVLTATNQGERGRVVKVEYLHGERELALPEIERATGNPVILYFFEQAVRDQHRRLGGVENYFRRRIRLALADAAQVRKVNFAWAGKEVEGTEVKIQPYLDDPLKDRFKGTEARAYILTLSSGVPGGVYELRTIVEGADKAGPPAEEETLTLKDKKS